MKARVTCAAIAALVVMSLPTGVSADLRAALTVRLYNTSHIPADELVAARRVGEFILQDTGLKAAFRYCRRPISPQDSGDLCADPRTSSEVVVRIVDAPTFNTTLPAEAFGVAYVVKETDRGWLATVFSDRINTAAARVGVAPGTLLGLVMAHEVGHLLLGVDYHGESGVMRADWPDTLLNRKTDDWRFSKLEAARIRHAASTHF